MIVIVLETPSPISMFDLVASFLIVITLDELPETTLKLLIPVHYVGRVCGSEFSIID